MILFFLLVFFIHSVSQFSQCVCVGRERKTLEDEYGKSFFQYGNFLLILFRTMAIYNELHTAIQLFFLFTALSFACVLLLEVSIVLKLCFLLSLRMVICDEFAYCI